MIRLALQTDWHVPWVMSAHFFTARSEQIIATRQAHGQVRVAWPLTCVLAMHCGMWLSVRAGISAALRVGAPQAAHAQTLRVHAYTRGALLLPVLLLHSAAVHAVLNYLQAPLVIIFNVCMRKVKCVWNLPSLILCTRARMPEHLPG